MSGQIGNIGRNTAEEFFETILMMTAYEQTKPIIAQFTKDIENPVIKEAVESSMNVLVFGMIFLLMQKQEALISKIFTIAEAIITALIVTPMGALKNKLKGLRGTKLFRKLGMGSNLMQERIGIAGIVTNHTGNHLRGQGVASGSSSSQVFEAVNSTKQTLYQREKLHMDLGATMAGRYNETLLFKVLTKSFTPQDEMLMKKILGRDTASVLHIDDMNKVADFMYTKDTNGKLTGLSEEFMNLINALGYLHNK